MKNKGVIYSLLIVVLFGSAFLVIRDDNTAMIGFPFYPHKMYFQAWVWYIGNHAGFITLSYIIFRIYKIIPAFVFLVWQVLDMVDFVLTANSIWFEMGVPVSMNTVGALFFTLSVLKYFSDEP